MVPCTAVQTCSTYVENFYARKTTAAAARMAKRKKKEKKKPPLVMPPLRRVPPCPGPSWQAPQSPAKSGKGLFDILHNLVASKERSHAQHTINTRPITAPLHYGFRECRCLSCRRWYTTFEISNTHEKLINLGSVKSSAGHPPPGEMGV